MAPFSRLLPLEKEGVSEDEEDGRGDRRDHESCANAFAREEVEELASELEGAVVKSSGKR